MEYQLGQLVEVYGGTYEIVGLTRMVYDADCEGEPEHKITKTIQKVAIATYYDDTTYQKPCWITVLKLEEELQKEKAVR